MINRTPQLVVVLAFTLAVAHAHADVILTSDFNAHGSTDGATSFTGISWSTNGVSDPGSSIALSASATVQTAGATENPDRLAVDRNIDTAGPWTIDIAFTATTDGLTLEDLIFDYEFISGGGTNQVAAHPDSGIVDVSILDASLSSLSTIQVGPLGTSDASSNSGTGIVADFADVALANGSDYTLRFTVSSNADSGNNMAVDNFVLNGAIVSGPSIPTPAALPAGLAMLGLVLARRRH